MQTRTQFKIIIIIGVVLSLNTSCSWQNDGSFVTAIERERLLKTDQIHAPAAGIPFYVPGNLDPTWSEQNIVTIPQFQLVDQSGKQQTEKIFEGKLSVITFAFTSCDGFCSTLVSNLKKVAHELKNLSNVQYVFLSVDPERDNAQKLKAYAQQMKLDPKNWVLLTGKREVIYGLAKNTFSSEAFRRESVSGNRIVHSEHFYLIDTHKRLRAILNGTRIDSAQEMKKIVVQI